GASLWAVLAAVVPQVAVWDWSNLATYTGFLALAYVASFVILVVPGGLGVREFLLTLFLVPEIGRLLGEKGEARALAILVVLLLRLVWTMAEVVAVSVVYWLPTGESQ